MITSYTLFISLHLSILHSHSLKHSISLKYSLQLSRTLHRALSIVEKVRDALRERLCEVPWMSDLTRVEAMKKMDGFSVKIGFPDKWIDYTTLVVKKGENLVNFYASNSFSFTLDLNRYLHTCVDCLCLFYFSCFFYYYLCSDTLGQPYSSLISLFIYVSIPLTFPLSLKHMHKLGLPRLSHSSLLHSPAD